MSTAFVFPGQGAQRPGMLGALPPGDAVAAVLAEAATTLGPLARLDTAAGQASTTDAQLALLVCGVAAARALTDDRGVAVDVVAGDSVGAFAAAVTAGVLTLDEALAVVRVRGDEMARACPPGRWGMAAVTGLSSRAVADLVAASGVSPGELWVASVNATDQTVLGGTLAALATAQQSAERAGARRFERLAVAVASHGPVQAHAETAVRQSLSAIPRRAQTADYLTNTGARRIHDDADAMLADLAAAVTRTVRWHDICRILPELGVTRAVALPPGRASVHMLEPYVRVTAVADDGYDLPGLRHQPP